MLRRGGPGGLARQSHEVRLREDPHQRCVLPHHRQAAQLFLEHHLRCGLQGRIHPGGDHVTPHDRSRPGLRRHLLRQRRAIRRNPEERMEKIALRDQAHQRLPPAHHREVTEPKMLHPSLQIPQPLVLLDGDDLPRHQVPHHHGRPLPRRQPPLHAQRHGGLGLGRLGLRRQRRRLRRGGFQLDHFRRGIFARFHGPPTSARSLPSSRSRVAGLRSLKKRCRSPPAPAIRSLSLHPLHTPRLSRASSPRRTRWRSPCTESCP